MKTNNNVTAEVPLEVDGVGLNVSTSEFINMIREDRTSGRAGRMTAKELDDFEKDLDSLREEANRSESRNPRGAF